MNKTNKAKQRKEGRNEGRENKQIGRISQVKILLLTKVEKIFYVIHYIFHCIIIHYVLYYIMYVI